MSEETDKTRLQAIIAQNKKIMDRLNIIMEMLSSKPMHYSTPDKGESTILSQEELDKLKEIKPFKIIKSTPEEFEIQTTEDFKPKERIISPDIVGTATDKPKQQYIIYLIGEETDMAVKVKYNDIEAWLAKSAIYGTYPNQLGRPIQMWIKSWIIKKNFMVAKE